MPVGSTGLDILLHDLGLTLGLRAHPQPHLLAALDLLHAALVERSLLLSVLLQELRWEGEAQGLRMAVLAGWGVGVWGIGV